MDTSDSRRHGALHAVAVVLLTALLVFLLAGCCTRRPVSRAPLYCPPDGTYRQECEDAIRNGRPTTTVPPVSDADFPPAAPLPIVEEEPACPT